MSIASQAPKYIRSISPYVPGKPISEVAREIGLPEERITKLASNENPRGMSPKARLAVERTIGGIERYPDQFGLIAALSDRLGVGRECIVLGNGSNDVLDLAARALLAPARSSVFSQHAFAVYALATQSAGAECIAVSAKDYGHDLAAMRAAIRADTRIVWIANPNNPTGTFIPGAELRAFLAGVPGDVAVVLDEAYNEYLAPADRADSQAWLGEFPNLVVTRTFSKVYGLAGLRVGYALASAEMADLMNRVRQPFNVNNLALAAAVAALDDHVFVADSFDLNRRGLEQLIAGVKRLGLDHIPSHGNFVAVRVGDADAVNRKLLAQGIIVRPVAGYGLPEHLRVTIGLERENLRFLEALEKAL
jgi:histidinol-phosphate aminotransferase